MKTRKIYALAAIPVVFLSFSAVMPAVAHADNAVRSGGSFTATQWDESKSGQYYRVDGSAIVDLHGGLVDRSNDWISYGRTDVLGRSTWSAGYITPEIWAREVAEERQSGSMPNPSGWPSSNSKVSIPLYNGKTYNGYLYNRSHLVADSLGGDAFVENLVTGTRTQNVGANDGKGGMAYAETIARNYMKKHPNGYLYYAATPVYVGDELVPRSVYVDMKSDDGQINSHIEVYNTAKGFAINYADGSWKKGDPNSTRGSLKAQKAGFVDVTSKTDHLDDVLWLADNKITTGFVQEDGTKTFRPYDEIARCDMAAFMFRLAKKWGIVNDSWNPTAKQKKAFADVNADTPHAKEVWWLAANGISEGWKEANGSKTFRPYETVARQDMAAFLFRLAKVAKKGGASDKWTASKASKERFWDVDPGGIDNHHNEVWWLAEKKVSEGWFFKGRYEFRGHLKIARCDMAAFLHRLENVK